MVIFLVLIVIGLFYLLKNNGTQIINFGKEKFTAIAESEIYSDLNRLENTTFNDTLKIEITKFFDDINVLPLENQVKKIKELKDNIDIITNDNQIDSLEFKFILRTLKIYERK